MELKTNNEVKENNDLYQKLVDEMIYRGNLIGVKVYDVMYSYMRYSIRELDSYKGESVTIDLYRECNLPQDYYRIYHLVQAGKLTSCILVSQKGSLRYLPLRATNVSELIENGINSSREVMNFTMDIPLNGDISKEWCFTKQLINCLGAFAETYKPLKKEIETIFCPLDVYSRAFDKCSVDPQSLDIVADNKIKTGNKDFVNSVIGKPEVSSKCTIIKAMETNNRGVYKVEITFSNGQREYELIGADSLYEAYNTYMERKNYYSTGSSTDKKMIYCTENKD